jgi:hypothetical protein
MVSELAGASEPEGHPRYTEMMLFAWDACEGRLLAHQDERCKEEILWGEKVTLERALVPAEARRKYRDHMMLNEEWARGVAATVNAAQDSNHAEERAKVVATIAGLDAEDAKAAKAAAEAGDTSPVTSWRTEFMKDEAAREALIVDWALDEMVTVAMHLGVPFARDRLPDPRTLPSFYFPKFVHVKRIHGVLLEEKSATNTDLYDLNALQDAACYADIFVTSDRNLLRLAGRVQPPCRVINFRTWDDELRALLA